MKTRHLIAILGAAAFALNMLPGCGGAATETDTHAEEDAEEAGKPGLAVGEAVRNNLGITFERVERRAVQQTLRVPGQFELVPSGRRDYHAALNGRVELHIRQYDTVEPGDLLATIDSPAWHEHQSELAQAQANILTAQAATATARAVLDERVQLVALLAERIERLASAEVRRIELETDLAQAELSLPRLRAEAQAAQVGEDSAAMQVRSLLLVASSLTGVSVQELMLEVEQDENGKPIALWQTIDRVAVLAKSAGVIDTLDVTSGQWAETGDHLLTAIAPRQLRFRAEALLADLGKLQDGLPAAIAPPTGTGLALGQPDDTTAARGALVIGPVAHAEDRAVSLYLTPDTVPDWARAGVAGYLEINLDPDAETELAIPRRALVRDGLEFVFFRRFPDDPDRVQRVVADTGRHDGKWIEIFSGAREGDEIVIDGVYQLLAASSTTLDKGGHFHADGTFHEGEH
ncbi:efflux RND transporter periplasmic adaptor subunit [Phycisphaeraceae bacterium D3-23]